jgi:hypothetical protein
MARKSREQTSDQTRVIGYVRVSSEQQTFAITGGQSV